MPFFYIVKLSLTVVWHHTQLFPCKPLIFFWHLSHFPDSQFPITQSWTETWTKHTQGKKSYHSINMHYWILILKTKTGPGKQCFPGMQSFKSTFQKSFYIAMATRSTILEIKRSQRICFSLEISSYHRPKKISLCFSAISPNGWTDFLGISHPHPFWTMCRLFVYPGKIPPVNAEPLL